VNATERIPRYYIPPKDTPMYWEDETSGELRTAMHAFITCGAGGDNYLPRDQFDLVKEYLVYFIRAPFWRRGAMLAGGNFERQLDYWINEAENIQSVPCAFKFTAKLAEAGIDPLGGRGVYE